MEKGASSVVRILFIVVCIFLFLLVVSHFFPIIKDAGGQLTNMSNTSEMFDFNILQGSGNGGSGDELGCSRIDIGTAAVKLYEHSNCNYEDAGFEITLVNEEYDIENLKEYDGKDYNDEISSLIVADGYKITLYEDSNYEDDYITFYGPVLVSNLNDHERSGTHDCGTFGLSRCQNRWGDDASSLNISKYEEEPIAILYRADNYKGSNRDFYEYDLSDPEELGFKISECVNLKDIGFDNVLSSIKIVDGYYVNLYGSKDCDLSGSGQFTLVKSERDVSKNDWASSIEIVERI